MNILADVSLPGLKQAFPAPFFITYYRNPDEITQLLPGQDILLCRSTLKVNKELLKNHRLTYVATASSGSDHLDKSWLYTQNIHVIDAKGSNARSVADYVVSCLAYLDQQKLTHGTKAGIIGMGKVGSEVLNRLQAADFQTVVYDPLKELQEKDQFKSCLLEDLYQVDLLCIHAELHDTQPYPSANLIDHQFLNKLKPGCVIINAARGGIVNEESLLSNPKSLTYCTDVYLNEPSIDTRILNKALLCTPHIAGHSLEAKYKAVAMISEALHQLEGLPLPQCATLKMNTFLSWKNDELWQKVALSIYNPLDETLILKKELDKKSAFLHLRKNHQKRHDFLLYIESVSSPKTRLILGALR